jgi:hypothetical protein
VFEPKTKTKLMLLAIVKTDKHTSKLFVKIVCANSYFEKILEDLAEPPPYARVHNCIKMRSFTVHNATQR